jgi:hypothetical protein
MGAIIGALIGRHYGQKWMEESSLVKSAMDNIQQAFQPGSTATDDFIDMNMNILRQRPGLKKMMPQIEAGIQRARAYRDAQAQGPQQPAQVAPEARVTSGAPLPSPGLPAPPPPESPELSQFRQMFPVPSIGGGSTGGPVPLTPPNAVIPPQVAQPSQQGGAGFTGTAGAAQAAPAQPEIPQQVAAPAQQGGQGFGGAPTPETFDQLRHVPGQLFNIPPYQVGQRQAAAALPHQEMAMAVRKSLIQEAKDMGLDSVQTADYVTGKGAQWSPLFIEGAKLAMEKQSVKDRIEAMKQPESGGPGKSIWDLLTPRQRAQVQSGDKNVTPELRPQNLPGRVTGASILAGNPDARDAFNQPIDPKINDYLVRETAYGKEYLAEAPAKTREMLVPDKNSKTGIAKSIVDRYGTEIGRVMDVVPPAGYMPKISTHQGIQVVQQANGELIPYPITSTTVTQPAIPGAGGAPLQPLISPSTVAPAAIQPGSRLPGSTTPAKAAAPAPGARVGAPGPVIGAKFSPEALDPVGKDVLAKAEPALKMVHRLLEVLEPYKNDNTPASSLWPRIAYKFGFDYDNKGEFLSNLEIGDLIGAARLMQPTGSRAIQTLQAAKIHTPQSWTDSKKLMYGKLKMMEQNIGDTIDAAYRFHKKSGIVPPSTELAAPPPGATVRMRAPNGQEKDVPAGDVEHFKARGAVIVK